MAVVVITKVKAPCLNDGAFLCTHTIYNCIYFVVYMMLYIMKELGIKQKGLVLVVGGILKQYGLNWTGSIL